eukprot:10244349-Lingulodinium_polyedra.AAC.1
MLAAPVPVVVFIDANAATLPRRVPGDADAGAQDPRLRDHVCERDLITVHSLEVFEGPHATWRGPNIARG